MLKIQFSRLVTLSGIACLGAMSQATFLNFDDGQANNSAVGGFYAGQCATFTNAMWVDNFGLAGSSGTQGIAHTTSVYQPQQNDPITCTFSAVTNFVTLRGLDVGWNGFILKAFDSVIGGSLVDTQSVTGTTSWGVGEYYDLTVTGSIRRVEFSQIQQTGVGDGMLFDNMEYQCVPEPGSFLAIGVGLAAVALRRRKAAK